MSVSISIIGTIEKKAYSGTVTYKEQRKKITKEHVRPLEQRRERQKNLIDGIVSAMRERNLHKGDWENK